MKRLNTRVVWVIIIFSMSSVVIYFSNTKRADKKTEVMVFAAMSLKQPFSKLASNYEEANPNVVLVINYSGSGNLAAQIISGASADIFASAGTREMDRVEQKGLIDEGTRRIFTFNSLVLVTPKGNPLKLRGFPDLASSAVKRIAIGDLRQAPVGMYAEQVLAYYKIKDKVEDKLIHCAQVAQVCDYTARGEVDAGLAFYSDYFIRKAELSLVELAPHASHEKIEYPIAVTVNSRSKYSANGFISFLCSDRGTEILNSYGFNTSKDR